MIRLLADCGNTTVKLALAEGSDIRAFARLPTKAAAWTAWLAAQMVEPVELVLLPGAKGWAGAVTSWWGERPIRTVGFELDLPNVGQYPGLGLDRIVAGLGLDAPAIIVDAGTATTLGAWSGAPLRFLGGLIAPGSAACSKGLADAAPALPTVSARAGLACQRDTEGALAVAMHLGYPAFIQACVQALMQETGVTRVVMTGGNADALAGLVGERGERDDMLVLRGLARLAA